MGDINFLINRTFLEIRMVLNHKSLDNYGRAFATSNPWKVYKETKIVVFITWIIFFVKDRIVNTNINSRIHLAQNGLSS